MNATNTKTTKAELVAALLETYQGELTEAELKAKTKLELQALWAHATQEDTVEELELPVEPEPEQQPEPKPEPEVDRTKALWQLKLARASGRYVKAKDEAGKTHVNNGDELAKLLLPLEPLQVLELAVRVNGAEVPSEFRAKATNGAWNPGQVRMNSGNKLRHWVKTGKVTLEDVAKAVAKG